MAAGMSAWSPSWRGNWRGNWRGGWRAGGLPRLGGPSYAFTIRQDGCFNALALLQQLGGPAEALADPPAAASGAPPTK